MRSIGLYSGLLNRCVSGASPRKDFGVLKENAERTAGRSGRCGADSRPTCQSFNADRRPRRAAIVTRSGSESAFILRIT